jgi:hypothetical protein
MHETRPRNQDLVFITLQSFLPQIVKEKTAIEFPSMLGPGYYVMTGTDRSEMRWLFPME